ncbi:MAG: hypothetical protein EBR82_36980 [Caulobacteraceae bacterium]|nr:hypothetical protein [Caulobacteraceae bacterium]
MANRRIVLGTNGRHSLRGVSAISPAEFLAYQDETDSLTYVIDAANYLETATISSVIRTASSLTVTSASNTTTTATQRLKGTGYVDIKLTLSTGEVDQFRITVRERVNQIVTDAYT